MAPNDKEKADLSSRVESWGGSRSSAAQPPLNTHYSISEPGPVPTAASDCLTAICTMSCTGSRFVFLFLCVETVVCHSCDTWLGQEMLHELRAPLHSAPYHLIRKTHKQILSLPLKSRYVQSFYWHILRPNDDRMWGDMKWRPSQGVRCAEISRLQPWRGGGRQQAASLSVDMFLSN